MSKFLQNARLDVKLPVVMVFLVVLTIIMMTTASVFMTQRSIAQAATTTLQTVAQVKNDRLLKLLHGIDRDIRLKSTDPSTPVALIALADGYNTLENAEEVLRRVYIDENEYPIGEKDKLVKADTGSSYGFIHAIYHPSFDELQNEMGYYDVFLFDTEGNLVYSVYKENDFATNMLDGPWAESGLAEAYRQASVAEATDPSIFIDFAPYGPSYDSPAAFIARPVFDTQGKRLGVLAYQMPVEQLSVAAGEFRGSDGTTDGFTVGQDRTLRTDSFSTEELDILKTVVDHDGITAAIAGQANHFKEMGHHGEEVMGYAMPLEFLGAKWATVVQQDVKEVFSGVFAAVLPTLVISAVVLAGATAISIFLSRSISNPLLHLTTAVNLVAEGETQTEVPGTERGDEIGELARKTEVFRQNAERIEKMVEEQKEASLRMSEMSAEREKAAQREIELAQEKERSDQETQRQHREMMLNLGQSFGDVVSAALDGDFSNRVPTDFADEILNDLSRNINELMAAVDVGLSKTGEALERVSKGDLTQRMTGTFQGAFHDLQCNVNDMLDALSSLIIEISTSGETLSDSSSELRQTADVLSRQAEENAASVAETSASIEQITANMEQVDANLADVSKNAIDARKTATESALVASQASESMDRIARGSQEINRVTDVINDIAFQINLLALNAGVEAARAGEAGRGFSVVASEVRQLAERASQAVSEIAQVLGESDAAVEEGVTNVANTKASLDAISARVISISESVEDVTLKFSEQASTIKEISSSVMQVDINTQKQAASFEEVTAASHQLAQEAQGLTKSTSRFRLSGVPNAKPEVPKKAEVPEKNTLQQSKMPIAVGAEHAGGWEDF